MRQSSLSSPASRGAWLKPETAVEGDAPLAALRGSDLSRRFRHWRGASGRRYLFSVFPVDSPGLLERCPRFDLAVVLAVQHGPEDRRDILHLDQTGTVPEMFFAGSQLGAAVAMGANEIHVHLLAENAEARMAILDDLAG